ncbi:Immunoglobulin superfamily DCC subclass member 3, partial [Clarias magur]
MTHSNKFHLVVSQQYLIRYKKITDFYVKHVPTLLKAGTLIWYYCYEETCCCPLILKRSLISTA